jgi:hypothetical protein
MRKIKKMRYIVLFRHEWFQNENFVTIEVFVKKIKPEDATIDIFERSVSVLSHSVIIY